LLEVRSIPRHYREPMSHGRSGDHRILHQRPSRTFPIPACISPTVTADMNSWSDGTCSIHLNTERCGRARRSS